MASPDQLTSFDTADLITKLSVLFTIVMSMFGAMHVGAALALVFESKESERIRAELMSDKCGYVHTEGDINLWDLNLVRKPADLPIAGRGSLGAEREARRFFSAMRSVGLAFPTVGARRVVGRKVACCMCGCVSR